MIGFLRGKIAEILEQGLLLDVAGVGYEIQLPGSQLAAIEQREDEVTLYTHLVFKEDKIGLYGFTSRFALEIFRMLIEVSGVGPKLAMNILSAISPQELLHILAAGDSTRLKSVHGVGKKTAERICVDLKSRARRLLKGTGKGDLSGIPDEKSLLQTVATPVNDALQGLISLGYRPNEARKAVDQAVAEAGNAADTETLLKRALQLLSKV